MKKILLSLAVLTSFIANAQLAPYSQAPDFTATDIDGVEHNLQTYLDEGKTVIMDVSATWCYPCWLFHQEGVLEEVYETYGPDGTDEVMVIWVEGDGTTTNADLLGTGSNTQGNWTTGVNFPIIDDEGIANDYEIGYFPTIYAICPSGFVIEIGQTDPTTGDYWTADAMVDRAGEICPPVPTTDTDAGVYSTNFPMTQPCGVGAIGEVTPEVLVINSGLTSLSSANIKTFKNGVLVNTDAYTGNAASSSSDWFTLSPVEVTGTDELTVTIEATGDANAANNEIDQPFNYMAIGGVEATAPLMEGIEELGANGWAYVDAEGDGGWLYWYDGGENGTDGSAIWYFFGAASGQVDRYVSPMMDFTGMNSVFCNFAWTKANYAWSNGTSSDDKLQIQVSTNCGSSWTTVWTKAGADLDTEDAVTTEWIFDGSSTWAHAAVDLSQWAGQENVLVSFTGTSDYGNNLFVDNINISSIASSVAEVVETFSTAVYPNPTKGILTINAERNTEIKIFDATGKMVENSFMNNPVQTLNLDAYGAGLYMVQLTHQGKTATHRVMVQQ